MTIAHLTAREIPPEALIAVAFFMWGWALRGWRDREHLRPRVRP